MSLFRPRTKRMVIAQHIVWTGGDQSELGSIPLNRF